MCKILAIRILSCNHNCKCFINDTIIVHVFIHSFAKYFLPLIIQFLIQFCFLFNLSLKFLKMFNLFHKYRWIQLKEDIFNLIILDLFVVKAGRFPWKRFRLLNGRFPWNDSDYYHCTKKQQGCQMRTILNDLCQHQSTSRFHIKSRLSHVSTADKLGLFIYTDMPRYAESPDWPRECRNEDKRGCK